MLATLPLSNNLVVYSGTTFRLHLRWLPDGTAPADLTGWAATLNIGSVNAPAVLSLNSAEGGGITLGADGTIEIMLTPAQTDALRAGSHSYTLDLDVPGGDINRFMRGQVSVIDDVLDPTL